MNPVRRINPQRPATIGSNGLRRIVVGKREAAAAVTPPKPRRMERDPLHWHMVVAHSDRGALDDRAAQAIAAAALLADPGTGVLVVVLGDLMADLAPYGADAIAVLPDFDAGSFQPEREVAAISAIIETYAPRHIFMADTAAGDGDLGRRLAASLGVSAATQVAELDASHATIAWSAGSVFASSQLPRIVLLGAGAVSTDLPFAGAGKLISTSELPAPLPFEPAFRDLGLEDAAATGVALDEADFIVSAGFGVRNIDTLQTLAQSLGAAVGASRVAVDEGKFPRDRQIGATGKTVSASAYIAVGISGAVQHLQGIKDCRHVIAINTDAGAAIAKRADLTIVGDAEEVMQALITRIGQARAQREIPEER